MRLPTRRLAPALFCTLGLLAGAAAPALGASQSSTSTPIGTIRLTIPTGWARVHRSGTSLAYRVPPGSRASVVMDQGTVSATLAHLLAQAQPHGAQRRRLLAHSTQAGGLAVTERAWRITPRHGQAFYLFLIALAKSGHRTVVLLDFSTPAKDLTASEPSFLNWIQSLSVLPRFQGTPWTAPDLGLSMLLPTGWEASGSPGRVMAAPSAAEMFTRRVQILALPAATPPQAALAGALAASLASLGPIGNLGPVTKSGQGYDRTFRVLGPAPLLGWAVSDLVSGRTLLGIALEPSGTSTALQAADEKILAHVMVMAPTGAAPYREFSARSGAFTAQVPASSTLVQGVSVMPRGRAFPTIGLYAQAGAEGLALLEGGPAVYDATGVKADLTAAARAAALAYLPGARALLSPILARGWTATGHPLRNVREVASGPVTQQRPAPGVVVERSQMRFTADEHGQAVHGLATGETVRMTTGQRVAGHLLWMWRVVKLGFVVVPEATHLFPAIGDLGALVGGFEPTSGLVHSVVSKGMSTGERLGRVSLRLMQVRPAAQVGFDGPSGTGQPAFGIQWK